MNVERIMTLADSYASHHSKADRFDLQSAVESLVQGQVTVTGLTVQRSKHE